MEHNNLKLILLFTFLLLSHSHTIQIHAQKNPCQPQYCGTNPLPIRFPFMLQQSQQAQSCGYGADFLLTCSSGHDQSRREAPHLNLPYSGNFSVRYINYLMQEIQLYDPDGCLPRRLMALNLTSSPFAAAATNDFIFLSCPRGAVATRFATVDCLGNATSAVMATTSVNLARAMNMCSVMYTRPIPVSWPAGDGGDGGDWLSSDLGGDLRLTWSFPDCQGCEAQGGVCGYDRNSSNRQIMCYFDHERGNRGLEIFKIIALSIVIPAIICSICISCFTCVVERRASRARAATVAAQLSPLPPPPTTGLDESTIESYTKVILGESKRLPGPNGVTCPICLVDYSPKDTLRCIPECQHCFHSKCVDEWLRLNSSCPVCRNSPSRSLEVV